LSLRSQIELELESVKQSGIIPLDLKERIDLLAKSQEALESYWRESRIDFKDDESISYDEASALVKIFGRGIDFANLDTEYNRHFSASQGNVKFLNLALRHDITDLSEFSKLEHLESLRLDAAQVHDLTPISKLRNLQILYLSNCGRLTNIEPLVGLPLFKLKLDYSGVTDFSPLLQIPTLRELTYGYTPASKDQEQLEIIERLRTEKYVKVGWTE